MQLLRRAVFQVILFLIVAVVSITFIISSFLHLQNPYQFFVTILRYDLVDNSFAMPLAVLLPAVQLVTGIWLLMRRHLIVPALLSTLFCATFCLLHIVTILRGLDISCGCFGTFSEVVTWKTVVRDFCLATGALVLFLHAFNSRNRR